MGREWLTATVRELQAEGILLVEDGNHGEYRPRPDEFSEDGTAFIRAADMDGGRVLFGKASRINDVARHRITKGIGKGADVLLSHKGTVGKVALVPRDAPPFVCSPQTTFWRALDLTRLTPEYLYVFLRSPEFHRQLSTRSGETDMAPYVSLTSQRGLTVRVPPIQVQRSIAVVVTALDDKIELNRRMNETLEALAQALFKSWFVDFDPVRAKMAGRAPFGMDAATASLFPSQLQSASMGDTPAEWQVRTLSSLTVKIGSGATPRGGDRAYVATGTSFIRSQNVYDSEFVWDGLVRITDADAEHLRGVTVKLNDILINITGASFLRTCIVDSAVLPARVSQHVAIIRAMPGVPAAFLHQHLLQPLTRSYLLGLDAGASRQAVTKGHLESVPVVVPSDGVLRKFAELSEPLLLMKTANQSQSRTLAELRDLLLPKLLSGELRIRDAEKAVEAAL